MWECFAYQLALPVLTKDIGINRASVHINLLRQDTSQPCTVEKCSASNHLSSGQARELVCKLGEDVYWVGNQKYHGVRFEWLHIIRG